MAETTMSDEASGRASDSDTAANEQPYDWDKCTFRLSITFLPGDGDEGGRQIIIGCNTHRDPPLIETVRDGGLGSLPPVIAGLLDGLKQRLPQRAEMAESRRRAEAAEEERLKLQQQQAREKIQAARQGSLAKSDRRQPPAPAPVREGVQSENLFDLGATSPAERTDAAEPAGSEQQSLFN
jgi:hypothetical protein